MPFAKPSEFSGGSYFKPLEHMNDLALLIEPKRVDKDQENTYQGKTTLRDEVVADITVFGTSESLEKQQPSAVLKNVRIVHGMLTSTAERVIGQAMVATVTKTQTKNGSGYVFRDVQAQVEAQVEGYYQQREAALDSAPDFD